MLYLAPETFKGGCAMAASVRDLFTSTNIETGVAAVRLVAAVVAGALIGLEREAHAKPAGFRTYIIICLGAALLMILSIYVPQQYFKNGDPARIAAQVVTGIGFLGAGAIFRLGVNVQGLTTAASIWTTAAIGLVIGAGLFAVAGIALALVLIALTVLDRFEKRLIGVLEYRSLVVESDRRPGQIGKITEVLARHGVPAHKLAVSEQLEQGRIEIRAVARLERRLDVRKFFDEIEAIDGIRHVQIE
jgi:putative Mg2+ transporter-C (MgtC) family protein